MANNTYWGTVPTKPEIIAPGEYEDNNGTENDGVAVWMGDCLVEGTVYQWRMFMVELAHKLIEYERKAGA